MGRRGKYETHVQPHLSEIPVWYEELNEEEIATQKLGIAVTTFEKYKNEHPELREALISGKKRLINELKDTLKRKARGFMYTEKKTITKTDKDGLSVTTEEYEKYSPPDTGAIHLLLKNIDDTWRNDDRETMDLKREKLEIEKKKADNNDW